MKRCAQTLRVLEELPVQSKCFEERPEAFRNGVTMRTVLWWGRGGPGAPSGRRSGVSKCVWCDMTGHVPFRKFLADSKELLPLKKPSMFCSFLVCLFVWFFFEF